MQCLAYGVSRIGDDTSAFFTSGHAVIASDWVAADMPIFIIIGLLGGLASAVLIVSCKKTFVLRARITKILGNNWSFFEVAVLTLLAVSSYTFLPLAFACEKDPAADEGAGRHLATSTNNTGATRVQRLHGSDDHSFLRYRCGEHYHNQMAAIAQGHPEHTIVQLWSVDTHYDSTVLVVYLFVFALQFVLLSGAKIPIGTFAPNMLMGSILGRLVGEFLARNSEAGVWSDPAVFAQVGAAAMLSGYTHMTLTIAAIIGEAVGTTALIVPLSTAILVSRSVTSMLAGDTVDEFQIHEKNLFFLESEVPVAMAGGTCDETGLIETDVPTLKMFMSPLMVAALLKKNELLGSKYTAFPVLSDSGYLQGLVSSGVLVKALHNKRWCDKHITSSNRSMMEVVMQAVDKNRRQSVPSSRRLSSPLALRGRSGSIVASKAKRLRRSGSIVSSMVMMRSPSLAEGKVHPSLSHLNNPSLIKVGKRLTNPRRSVVGKRTLFKYCRFAIRKSMDMGAIMDAAPFSFHLNTPIDRVYDAFTKMNLSVVTVVSGTSNRFKGVITRTKLIEFNGLAHRAHKTALALAGALPEV
jgi:hypothetical protein